MTLLPQDWPLPRRPLRVRVFPWGKLPVTRLDLLLSQRWLVCEPALFWAKPLVKQPPQAMRRSRLSRPSSRLSYASDVSPAIRPD